TEMRLEGWLRWILGGKQGVPIDVSLEVVDLPERDDIPAHADVRQHGAVSTDQLPSLCIVSMQVRCYGRAAVDIGLGGVDGGDGAPDRSDRRFPTPGQRVRVSSEPALTRAALPARSCSPSRLTWHSGWLRRCSPCRPRAARA